MTENMVSNVIPAPTITWERERTVQRAKELAQNRYMKIKKNQNLKNYEKIICVISHNPTRQEPGEAVGSIGVNGEGNPKFPKGIKVFLFAIHPNRLCGIIQRPLIKHIIHQK